MPEMGQITVRAGDEIVQRVKEDAASQGRSMNDYVTAVLDAATNPNLAGDEASRVRERLARAGLLAPSAVRRQRPAAEAVAAARIAAGRGTSLSELVAQDHQ
ncbi:MAG: toxin-antitoxin system HicB family antitoxin [Acidimicrobiales bacterium]